MPFASELGRGLRGLGVRGLVLAGSESRGLRGPRFQDPDAAAAGREHEDERGRDDDQELLPVALERNGAGLSGSGSGSHGGHRWFSSAQRPLPNSATRALS